MKPIFAILFLTLIAACSHNPTPNPTMHHTTQTDPSGIWQAENPHNNPLILRLANGQINLENGCNTPSAHYTQQNNNLQITGTRATRMMCETELMQRDALAAELFNAQNVEFEPQNQILTFQTTQGTHRFVRQK